MRQQKKQSRKATDQLNAPTVRVSKANRKMVVPEPQKSILPPGIRRIKIRPKFVDRIGSNTFVPLIMLKGEWLRKMGFECQGHVLIREEAGELVIKLERDLY